MARRPVRPNQGAPNASRAAEAEALARFEGRFEQFAEGLLARLDGIERDARSGQLAQERLSTEFNEVRRDSGELRDGLALLSEEVRRLKAEQPAEVAAGAAEGAASGAARTAREVAPLLASEVVKQFWNSWIAKMGAFGISILAFLGLVQNGGPVARALDGLWQWLKGL